MESSWFVQALHHLWPRAGKAWTQVGLSRSDRTIIKIPALWTPDFLHRLEAFHPVTAANARDILRRGCFVKFFRQPQDGEHERSMLMRMNNSKPVSLQGIGTFDASIHAPRIVFAGNIKGIYVLVTTSAPGEQMKSMLTRRRVDVGGTRMASIVSAVLAMWLSAGIFHGDMHAENVFIAPSTSNRNIVTIIDYGTSFILPPKAKNALKKKLIDGQPANLVEILQLIINWSEENEKLLYTTFMKHNPRAFGMLSNIKAVLEMDLGINTRNALYNRRDRFGNYNSSNRALVNKMVKRIFSRAATKKRKLTN